MTKQEVMSLVGGLSSPSKMPGHGYSISAAKCNVGSKLRKVKGSVCSHCYACKGRYVFPNVQNAMQKRYDSMADLTQWTFNMVQAIEASGDQYFRWHDSGDLQSIEHLMAIVQVAVMTPKVMHWLPTKEYAVVRQYKKQYGMFPTNLTVRVSAPMVAGQAPDLGQPTSTVVTHVEQATCPAPKQGGKCLECRKCWDANTMNVAYLAH